MNLRKLGQHLEDLRDLRSKLSFLITEVETEMRRQRATEAMTAPVKAFENHWKSMGKPAEPSLPMKYTIWGDPNKNTGIGKLCQYVDYFDPAPPRLLDAQTIMSALKKTGGIEPVTQADGHAEPVNDSPYDSVGDATAYANYRTVVYNCGPYYTYDAWKRQGRPRA